MILPRLGTWISSSGRWFVWERLYKNGVWTIWCRVRLRYLKTNRESIRLGHETKMQDWLQSETVFYHAVARLYKEYLSGTGEFEDECSQTLSEIAPPLKQDEFTDDQIVRALKQCYKNFDFLKEDSEERKAWKNVWKQLEEVGLIK